MFHSTQPRHADVCAAPQQLPVRHAAICWPPRRPLNRQLPRNASIRNQRRPPALVGHVCAPSQSYVVEQQQRQPLPELQLLLPVVHHWRERRPRLTMAPQRLSATTPTGHSIVSRLASLCPRIFLPIYAHTLFLHLAGWRRANWARTSRTMRPRIMCPDYTNAWWICARPTPNWRWEYIKTS